MNRLSINLNRRTFLLLALLLVGGIASAQVTIKKNVYGGCKLGAVKNIDGTTTIINNATVTINDGTIEGCVYGGGEGALEDNEETGIQAENAGLVEGNTTVNMRGGTVKESIYGGGQLGSVGTFNDFDPRPNNAFSPAVNVRIPTACMENTGLATVNISGGLVGILNQLMPSVTDPDYNPAMDMTGYVFCGGQGEIDSVTYLKANLLGVVGSTHLEISKRDNVTPPLIAASVYGGSENGLVLDDVYVNIAGGQIGIGHYKDATNQNHWDGIYDEDDHWGPAIQAVQDGNADAINTIAAQFHECDAFSYVAPYKVYDIYANQYDSQGGATIGTNGHTFFGNVFGGGSGFYPYEPGHWRRTAGQVNGDVTIKITGGHILTSVYGGNEITDVLGSVSVSMSGGTLGVPRTLATIDAHPVTCYLFGAGMGDTRTPFNNWSDVKGNVTVDVSGGTIFGSVFGGGEDGHVIGDVSLTIRESISGTETIRPHIGTWGTSTVDGNVFGAGRGFSGIALTAGGVGGNTEVNIEGGTMLGSVYGGGRLASVGPHFVAPGTQYYGSLQDDTDTKTHGYTTVNIKGGTIGNSFEVESDDFDNYKGGNVFGGSKGRMTLLDNTTLIERWEDLGKVKGTTVNINETTANTLVIKGHVFGGGEIGRVEKNTLVDIDKGTIGYDYNDNGTHIRQGGDVYGGGMGLLTNDFGSSVKVENTGLVKGNTMVDMSGGFVQRSLYGGGKYGSVGTFTEYYDANTAHGFFIAGEPKKCDEGTGLAKVLISGGQVGFTQTLMPAPGTTTYGDDFGYVFCGSRGEADSLSFPRVNFYAVVDTTYLEISNNALITASAYGGCENGMVLRDTHVKIAGGQIGVGYYEENNEAHTPHWDAPYADDLWKKAIDSVSAGKMTDNIANSFHDCDAWSYGNGTLNEQGYPNGPFKVYDIFADQEHYPEYYEQVQEYASLSATDGNTFFGKVYGGGSGYYPIAPGVWRRSAGRVNGNTLVEITGGHILTAVFGGNEMTDVLCTATVNMSGGTVGVPRTFQEIRNTPTTCHIFGSGMGDMRTMFNTWTNVENVEMNITGGTVFGSVFGGGEDGHVLSDVTLTVSQEDDEVPTLIGTYGHSLFDGNVFGGGRGFSGDALTAGSVGGNTEVNIEGGQVLGSVYGGGRLASVGIDFLNPNNNNYGHLQNGTDHGYTTVNVTGGTIGGFYENDYTIEQHRISGNVYGGSKGRLTKMDYVTMNPHWPSLAKVKQTEVTIDGADVVIKGDVFGGGEIGTVRDSTQVVVKNGTLMRDLFGGGYGSISTETVTPCDSANMTPRMIAGRVYGRTDATVSGGLVKHNVYGGGEYAKVGTFANNGQSTVSLNGGVVGSHVGEGANQTLFGGMVYGGGMGIMETVADTIVAKVHGCTYIYDTLSPTNPAHVLGNIHGGGELALVERHTNLILGSLEVGTLEEVTPTTQTVTKPIPDGTTATLYQVLALEGGRVFGGGKGLEDPNKRLAALVMGNTYTEIKGSAKVYGSVYGGGELANVGSGTTLDNDKNTGSATVTISGGTIGPLNGSQRNGNVFGGGKGLEEMTELDDVYYATVDSTHVVISGNANIAGSVFGGGANGRVLGNASTDIQGGTIGTTGLTTWDGNVFGGGRNLNAYANTAAVVRGNTDIQMSGGTIKANMYGGGRFGSVGMDYNADHTSIDTIQGADHGYVNINITGGTIGDAYVQYLGTYNATNPDDDMPRTGFVFGGGRGIVDVDKIDKLGNVKGTTVTVGGTALVKSSVYGGSERGIVYKNTLVKMKGNAEVGENSATMALHRGDVYGGGCGFDSIAQGSTYVFLPESGRVKGSTRVEMDGSNVYGNVFGGGEEGHVIHNTHVVVTDGTVGITGSTGNDGNVFGAGRGKRPIITGAASAAVSGNSQVDIQDGRIKGSVFGGGDKGSVGVYLTETTVNGVTYQPGDTIAGTDHGYTLVNVSGGWIGHEDTNGRTGGNVYGGCRGAVVDPDITTIYQNMAHVKQTEVNIFESDTTHTFIMGSVFGGGEDGHVFKDTYVNVSDGQIGGSAYSSTPSLCSDRHHGNVYGGGRGLDTYTGTDNQEHYSTTAGKVYGNTNVLITGGYITRNVYGGGNLSTVGIADEVPTNDVYKTGLAKVTITGGTVGVLPDLTNVNGMVFGSARGMAGEAYKDLAMVKNTQVVITGNAQVKGSVFGSGEDGHTRMRTNVIVGDATVNGTSYTGNGLVIGTTGASGIDGNVYGGGRGLDEDESHNLSSTAGIVGISTTTLINNGTVLGSVFGGGNLASVGYEHVLPTDQNNQLIIPDDYGLATVTVTGTATIGSVSSELENGNVFGSGKGRMAENEQEQTLAELSYVHETEVLVNGNAKVYGSVFGGGEDGHVRAYTVTGQTQPLKIGNTHVTIDGSATIGNQSEQESAMKGNVYGGGRGLDKDHLGNNSPTAGIVEGNTKVDILNGTIWRSVFGGGNESVVKGLKVTNVVNGLIHADVHGGSNAIPSNDAAWAHGGLKTVNIRGGHVMGDVYGCSHSSNDGDVELNAEKWTSFVNISGGTIDEDVHGAGYAGMVNGSVCVNIGKDAILTAPNKNYNVNYNKPHTGNWDQTGTVEPTAATLVIGGSVYGGSDFYGTQTDNDFEDYDLTGYSLIFIDGTGYNTTDGSTATNYMNIGGGLFGSGTHTESGALGRHILLKDYGTRNEENGEMTSATRTLTTIQRAGNVIIDHANVNLSGLTDISSTTDETKYGVMRVADTLAVINASGIVLGSEGHPVYMDSIYTVQSLNLAGTGTSIYNHNLNELKKHSWYWLGIQDEVNEATLYNISGTGTNAQPFGQLTSAQENVILYNDKSKLWVRYHDMKENDTEYKQYYGELLGFFRMRADAYDPYDLSESFAYARPKYSDYTAIPELDETGNLSDGGFLSYNTDLNFFFDDGNQYTKTKQHPYLHPYLLTHGRNDVQEYRYWVAERNAHRWYVDGTRGWGRDVLKSDDPEAGRYPNKPKKTLFGTVEDDENGVQNSGVVNEQFSLDKYVYETDIIYVVGALSAADEKEIVRGYGDGTNHKIPLKLFRYPGGHFMSNNKIDSGTGDYWVDESVAGYDEYWYPVTLNAGPGMNKGAMVDVQTNANLTMKAVVLDGLSNYTDDDVVLHDIPTSTSTGLPDDCQLFDTTLVTEPLIITRSLSTLTLGDSTVLMRGYNHTNAADWGGNNHLDWYNQAFYDTAYMNLHNNNADYIHETGFRHGGAIYVDGSVDKNGNDIGATVYVKDTVYITNNKQHLKIGNGDDEYIESNVFLPTFHKNLYITGRGALDENTRIGVTSPRGNDAPRYTANTFSPVAVATRQGETDNQPNSVIDARSAWENNNFYDDLNWFFVKGHVDDDNARTTYYGALEQFDRVSFGWTWANVVRKQPSGYAVAGSAISISSEQGLAWLISVVNGMNRQTASDLNEKTVSLVTAENGDIKDIYDMQQYVWVPVGGNPSGQPFAGTFDGNGHLITELYVDYLGKGDRIYKYNDYGMFGRVNGTIDRTFLVSGMIRPDCTIDLTEAQTYNVGGLVGILNGSTSMVSNSEAAMEIKGPKKDNLSTVAGGLVGQMNAGEVHSSMAVPDITVGPSSTMAGLVGSSAAGNINNSFVHATLTVDGDVKTDIKAGGLLGVNTGAKMENCYLATITPTNLTGIVYDSIVASNSGTVDYSYVMTKYTGNGVGSHCGYYAPVISSDELGYMYADNRVNSGSTTDTTLFVQLNRWVDNNNRAVHKYATWARPGLREINGDLPVLLLSEYDKAKAHQGGFRSMGTYAGGPVLQYGGPVRDVNEVGTALTRSQENVNKKDNLFIYGDVVSNISLPAGESITQGKVSIYEHAAILSAGDLADFENTYVGITFDNSKTHAMSTHGVNGLGMQDLPRDWHMMSTPLAEAPLGFNYVLNDDSQTNTNEQPYGGGNQGPFYNNPWFDPNPSKEFNWLNDGHSGNNRYWMKDYADADGYFPTQRGALFSESTDPDQPLDSEIGKLFIENSDEHPSSDVFRYPYGMDFFTWYEPEYHWVNFKRNGPNHWHSDEPHQHLEYFGSDDNVNEETLIKGRGYMAAISIPTFLQSHGKLNKTSASIPLTQQGTYCTGWNLVGNPFHGYLDFDAFAIANGLGDNASYVVYDADGYHDFPESAFLTYVKQGSEGGAYAGRYLHPHQGFFLFANKSQAEFNEASIVDARASLGVGSDFDGHFRGEDLPRYPLVNLFLTSDNGCSDVTVVEFERPEWGGAIKLPELRNGDGLFYGFHEGNRYAALFAQEGTTRVPLWFEAKEDDIFTMKWKTANGDFTSLYLIDNLKGIEYDMLANDAYTFEGHKEDYYSRFYIVFNVNDVEEHHEHSIAFFDGSQWVVTGEGELDFIDLQGRILWHGKLSGGQTRVNFPVVAKGMYLLRLVNPDETKVQKIIVK